MEGDAGARRLNPPPMSMLSRLRRRRPKIREESENVADETNSPVTSEDSPESVDTASAEDAAGAADETADAQPAPLDDAAEPDADVETEIAALADEATPADDDATGRRPSRLSRGWLAGIAAVLVLLAAAVGTGGYFALRYHHQTQEIARNNAAALRAAIDCVAATQAPDTNAMIAAEQKIIDCGTDAFRAQALLYTGMLVQAYKESNVHVQVSDVRAAVERTNSDGSVDVLVAMRVKVASDQSQNETGYRLRVKMALDEGQYRIAKLDQVTK
ncbi:Mce protein [Mycobacterium sherrisii]|uniref:Mce protein n=1 Tax=Mycobacterium sherrisii TaxID=243061 RepID=A0A1E3SQB4_9MYCO|nr:Mce protein [Mycobacterium sherrisii]MCV7028060.1 Mce protein [Mycobacterium sherrisii]MEC4762780.1 Mce protein [Mycobacterium sherrisii]ODR04292.1 Mce protein [Mycobacterium sherrisii]ORW78804.1 Mce protein [Mycobacterium sherrisii]